MALATVDAGADIPWRIIVRMHVAGIGAATGRRIRVSQDRIRQHRVVNDLLILDSSAQTGTDGGSLRIVAIQESLTVPAGSFDTIHYRRILNSTGGSTVQTIN